LDFIPDFSVTIFHNSGCETMLIEFYLLLSCIRVSSFEYKIEIKTLQNQITSMFY